MMFADSVGVGFVAVLGFVAILALLASAVWSNRDNGGAKNRKASWEPSEPSAKDQLKIILVIAAVLLVCIVLAALGSK